MTVSQLKQSWTVAPEKARSNWAGSAAEVSETKVEDQLRQELRSWARTYRTSGTGASVSEIGLTLTAVAVAAQQVDVDNVRFASDWSVGEASETSYDDWASSEEGTSDWGADVDTPYPEGGWGDGS